MILLQAQSAGNSMYSLLLMGGIFVVMYFFMIRPQQQKVKEQQKFQDTIREGEQVVTIGGMHGRITEVGDKTIGLDVGRGVKLTFDKSAISRESTLRVRNTQA